MVSTLTLDHAYYKVVEAGFIPDKGVGEVCLLDKGTGDLWVVYGLLVRCDSSGNEVEEGKHLIVGVEQKASTLEVEATTLGIKDTGTPTNEGVDLNSASTARTEEQLEQTGKIVKKSDLGK